MVPFGSSHNACLTQFCYELDQGKNIYYDRERTFTWGKPDVYVNTYGPIEIISKAYSIDKEDLAKGQKCANKSRCKCTLICFATRHTAPLFLVFYPQN
ncbi:UNVERIFIED_CONTAM: hypothetical protein RMT77_016036 [Armadillidium vulgare]